MNNIDHLMDLDPDELTSDGLDEIIAFHRQNRGADGPKAKKDSGPKLKLDSVIVNLVQPKPTETFKRRI